MKIPVPPSCRLAGGSVRATAEGSEESDPKRLTCSMFRRSPRAGQSLCRGALLRASLSFLLRDRILKRFAATKYPAGADERLCRVAEANICPSASPASSHDPAEATPGQFYGEQYEKELKTNSVAQVSSRSWQGELAASMVRLRVAARSPMAPSLFQSSLTSMGGRTLMTMTSILRHGAFKASKTAASAKQGQPTRVHTSCSAFSSNDGNSRPCGDSTLRF